MSKSNIKGAYERARQRWKFGAIYIGRRLGRASTGALTAIAHLEEYACRELFLMTTVMRAAQDA